MRLVTNSNSFEACKLGNWGSWVIIVFMLWVRKPGSHGSITDKRDQILNYSWTLWHRVKKYGQCTYKRNIESCSCNHCCCLEEINVTCSGCVFVALVIQHAVRMGLLYSQLWPVWLYHILPQYLTNGTIFGGKKIVHKLCVLIFSTPFVWNIYNSQNNWTKNDQKRTSDCT